ncbi:MAG TPA: hypothetical protein VNI34_08870 [Candidatus Nitrosotalea sp.]|nr:hypothetical protein [Candidatus Nitrosotalea sp.]
MKRKAPVRRPVRRPAVAERPTITVRFNDPAQHELLSLVAGERHTSVNQLIQDLIDAPLHEAAGELEGKLVRMVEVLRSMTGVQRARSITAAARETSEAEGKYQDPLRARRISREDALNLRRALDEGRAEPDLG